MWPGGTCLKTPLGRLQTGRLPSPHSWAPRSRVWRCLHRKLRSPGTRWISCLQFSGWRSRGQVHYCQSVMHPGGLLTQMIPEIQHQGGAVRQRSALRLRWDTEGDVSHPKLLTQRVPIPPSQYLQSFLMLFQTPFKGNSHWPREAPGILSPLGCLKNPLTAS